MKKNILLGMILLVIGFFSVGMAWADENIPNLLGTWESQIVKNHQHSAATGHKTPHEHVFSVVEGQDGRSFFGHKEKLIGKQVVEKEKFPRAIYWDNNTIYLVDHEKGFNQGTSESTTEIRGLYLEDSSNAMVVLYTWKKTK